MDELTRRCTATNRQGQQCGRAPIPGGFVCVVHGGGAPAVQQSAKARLLAGADLAIDYLLNLLTPKPPCETCGRSDADRDPVVVRACQLVLDRSGFHPSLTVEHATPPPNTYEDLDEDQIIERLEALLKNCYETRDFKRRAEQFALAPCRPDDDDGGLLPEAMDGVLLDDAGFEVPDEADSSPIQNPDVQNPSGNGTPEKCKTDDEAAK